MQILVWLLVAALLLALSVSAAARQSATSGREVH